MCFLSLIFFSVFANADGGVPVSFTEKQLKGNQESMKKSRTGEYQLEASRDKQIVYKLKG